MLLRFREIFFAHFAFLVLTFFCDKQIALAIQETGDASRPNSLRIGDPKRSVNAPIPSRLERISPFVERNANQIPVDERLPRESIVRANGNGLPNVDNSSSRVQSDDCDAVSTDQMELALRIATASMSHASPFLWIMAGPASNLFVDKTVEEEPNDELAMDLEDVDLSEPPRLIRVDEISFGSLVIDESVPTQDDATIEIDKPKPKGNKPTARTIRVPFEKQLEVPDQESRSSNATPGPLSQERDSQKNQEEPKLDSGTQGNEKEHQGVDALRASKPVINRREIRIDDPSNQEIQVAPIVQSKSVDPILQKRLQRSEACLTHYRDNPESTSVRSPWAVMHALLAFGVDYELVHGQSRVNAIGWMCHNGTCRTQRIFTPTARSFTPNVGDGVQGHEGQFMAILAQSNVPLNYPIQIGTSKFTVEDLVRHEMMTCRENSELTFKLIGLSYYLDSNKQWRANDGKQWSISKLIQEEMEQPIIGAACGGVHRLMGFSFSVRQRQMQGQPVNGQFARAAKFVHDYTEYTWRLQNPDGSFSTNWYEGRANDPNEERKVQTTGHMLEWLMYTLSDEELGSPRVGKSIDFLLSKIYDKREQKWPIGPRGHATRAIALYQGRTREVLSKPAPTTPINSASKSGTTPVRVRK